MIVFFLSAKVIAHTNIKGNKIILFELENIWNAEILIIYVYRLDSDNKSH